MIGQNVYQYQFTELIGEGGMGTVYRAKDKKLDRNVAIKMMHRHFIHEPQFLKRFKNEAKLSAIINHPHVATLYDYFEQGNDHYLVMEFVDGNTLEKILKMEGVLSCTQVLKILTQLLEGLSYAHQLGITHRDIKPANIMLNSNGYVKLMDFGIARHNDSERLTRVNRVIGTIEYMSPELLKGGEPSIQSDLYAVGILAYELIYGHTPFCGGTEAETFHAILNKKARFKNLNDSAYPSLLRIIKKLIRKNPLDRYINGEEVIRDLIKSSISGRISLEKLKKHENRSNTLFSYQEILKKVETFRFPNFSHKNISFPLKIKSLEGRIISASAVIALLIFLFSFILKDKQNDHQIANDLANTSLLSVNPMIEKQDSHANAAEDAIVKAKESIPEKNPISDLPDEGGEEVVESPKNEPKNEQPSPKSPKKDGTGNEEKEKAEKKSKKQIPDKLDQKEDQGQNIADLKEDSLKIMHSKEQEIVAKDREISEEKKEEAKLKTITINVPELEIVGIFANNVSSNTHSKGEIVYLNTANSVYSQGYKIISAGARIKARVKDSKSGLNKGKAYLAIEILEVEDVNSGWIPVQYPLYSDKNNEKVMFEKGRTIRHLRLKAGKISLRVPL